MMILKTVDEMLSENFAILSKYKKEKCGEILEYLQNNTFVLGVLLGGSISYKEDIEKSDIDLFCLINHVEIFEIDLIDNVHRLADVDTIIYQGSFPWTGKLYTVYYKQDIDFSIDICMIDAESAKTFFWEPDGHILFDKQETIKKCRNSQMSKPEFTRQPFLKPNPFSLSVITLKKIDKNLSRGHLWNALEQLSILRRYIMQIIRLDVIKNNYFLGRVDRDIEDVIPPEINSKLSQTLAIYSANNIALKAILLIELLTTLTDHLRDNKEHPFQEWILKQLEHEKSKLANYF